MGQAIIFTTTTNETRASSGNKNLENEMILKGSANP